MNIIRTLIFFELVFIPIQTLGEEQSNPFGYSPKTNFNSEIVDSKTLDHNDSTFEKIVIDGFNSKVPFYLIIPKNKKDNKYVFILHGIANSKEEYIYPTNKYSILKDHLLMKGYSIVIPDAKYHGERSYQGNFTPPINFWASQDHEKIHDLLSATVKDVRIMMDYIEIRSGSSPATFIVVGHSMGGSLTILLNSVDDRLSKAIVWLPPLDAQKSAMALGMTKANAEKLIDLSPGHYASLQKSPISMHMGEKDKWYTKEEVLIFYEKVDTTGKSLTFYDTGHYLPDEFITDTLKSIESR